MIQQFIAEPFEFASKLRADEVTAGGELGFAFWQYEVGVAGDGLGLGAEEVPQVVPRRVDVEDVGAVDLGVVVPESHDVAIVGGRVVDGDEVAIYGGEVDHSGFGHHAEEFDTAGADEG